MNPVCPYCRTDIAPSDDRVDCSGCGTPHHADCFAENGGCTVFGCSQAPVDEPKLTVTGSEAAQAVGPAPVAPAPVTYVAPPSPVHPVPPARSVTVERPPSVLGLSEPLSLDGAEMSPVELSAPAPFLSAAPDSSASPAAPPPLPPSADSTSVPPPPPPPGMPVRQWAPQSGEPPLSLAEAYASYHPPKSRVTFVLLGVFPGALGVHNFYAGYVRKAVGQLCLTLFTCFYGSIVSWIWAVVEVCIVKQDSEGVQFTS